MSTLQLLAPENQKTELAGAPRSAEVLLGESCLGSFDHQFLLVADYFSSLGPHRPSALGETRPQGNLRGTDGVRRPHTHTGEWVAMQGDQMLSHGADPVRVVAEARERGARVPYLFRVPRPDEDVVRIGL